MPVLIIYPGDGDVAGNVAIYLLSISEQWLLRGNVIGRFGDI